MGTLTISEDAEFSSGSALFAKIKASSGIYGAFCNTFDLH